MVKRRNVLRLIGLGLLALLLWRLDTRQIAAILGGAEWTLVAAAFALNLPQVLLKGMRWRWLLKAQGIRYGVMPASLAYFGSIFIGLFTPGRLGEFIKAVHVSRDCNVPAKRAFSSVLADRLFDLYALAIVGGLALVALGSIRPLVLLGSLGGLALALILPLVLLLNGRAFVWMQSWGMRLGKLGRALFTPEGWVAELRNGLLQLGWTSLGQALALTVLAYAVLYTQAFLLALALDIDIGVLQVSFAMALGSLVTLIPVSISGLGTREAAVVAYLGADGVGLEAAMSFSLLVFITFYVGAAVIGAVAWFVKPVSLNETRAKQLFKERAIGE